MLNGNSKDIITESDKTQLLCATSSFVPEQSSDIIIESDKTQLLCATSRFMPEQSSGIYNVCFSKKTNKVDI